jgi:hypothetical protein
MAARAPSLPFSLAPLIKEARERARRRRLLVAVVLLLVAAAGAARLVIADSSGGMSSKQAAQSLGRDLRNTDRYVCSATTGPAPPGEPAWTYLCLNATHPNLTGYFVLSKGARIARIEPAG